MKLLVGEVEADVAERALGLLQHGVGLELVVAVQPETEQDHAPLLALGEGLVSPALYLSYFELPERAATRSKVAIALAMPSSVTRCRRLSRTVRCSRNLPSRSMICLYFCLPISIGFCIGPCAWPSSDGAPAVPEHRLSIGRVDHAGRLRPPVWPAIPIETGMPSVHPLAGLWQVAQLTVPSSETRGSK